MDTRLVYSISTLIILLLLDLLLCCDCNMFDRDDMLTGRVALMWSLLPAKIPVRMPGLSDDACPGCAPPLRGRRERARGEEAAESRRTRA